MTVLSIKTTHREKRRYNNAGLGEFHKEGDAQARERLDEIGYPEPTARLAAKEKLLKNFGGTHLCEEFYI